MDSSDYILGLYRRGDVIYRDGPKVTDRADVTFIWDDPTPDIDGNGDEIIIAFGNPSRCPDTCSEIVQINSDATYQRRWQRWQEENPSWTPSEVIEGGGKGPQCYNLVNYMAGMRPRDTAPTLFDVTRPRDLGWWRRKTGAP